MINAVNTFKCHCCKCTVEYYCENDQWPGYCFLCYPTHTHHPITALPCSSTCHRCGTTLEDMSEVRGVEQLMCPACSPVMRWLQTSEPKRPVNDDLPF